MLLLLNFPRVDLLEKKKAIWKEFYNNVAYTGGEFDNQRMAP